MKTVVYFWFIVTEEKQSFTPLLLLSDEADQDKRRERCEILPRETCRTEQLHEYWCCRLEK